ncbi:helix-turn-helix domain-containing protein [Pseudooceanicola marinus]|uniref:winged helix-turn-helix domain-containing protein n=1 Tax=Pseudooceanicola marinus TaxID=396013 RepID=UPI001CD7E5B2|nr:helix-turn-helix domain-containing protein [Pseudooceanicola marinus]MCA1334644.1 winged helix-turn-helix domain-containing protein [Pseudooceanicola marinus]
MTDDRDTLIFAEDFRSARVGTGEALTFTRAEARTLALLTRHAPRVTAREALLEAAGDLRGERGDRSVDFVINRLRRKLGDDARAPRYIATRYGEGYAWVGAPPVTAEPLEGADIVLGPVRGTELLDGLGPRADAFTDALLRGLRREMGQGRRVSFRPAGDSGAGPTVDAPRYRVELVFLVESGVLHCVLVARDHASGRVLTMRRHALEPAADVAEVAQQTAAQILDNAWLGLVSAPELQGPLPVAMQAANLVVERGDDVRAADGTQLLKSRLDRRERHSLASWRRAEARIDQLRAERPDDPHLKILQAVHLHTKHVLLGHKLLAAGVDDRAQDEARIEILVTEALPGVSGEPQFTLMAAKLLHFVTPTLGAMVRGLAEEAHARSLDVAGSLPVIGQLRVFLGDTEAGLTCLEQALRLTEAGSQAHLYALVLKCQALVAAGDAARLAEAQAALYAQSALAPLFFEPFFGSAATPTIRGRLAARAMRRPFLVGMLANQHYVSARLFAHREHRDNAIRNALDLVIRRFGAEAVPAEVRQAHPALVAASRREVGA